MKGLTQKLGTSQSRVDPASLTAAFDNRSDPREALNLGSIFVTVPVGAESDQKARGQHVSGTRKTIEKLLVGVLTEKALNRLIKAFDGGAKESQLLNASLHDEYRGANDRGVSGERQSRLNLLRSVRQGL